MLCQDILQRLKISLNLAPGSCVKLIAYLIYSVLRLESKGIRFVFGIDGFFTLLILSFILLGIFYGSVDLVVRHA